jgi:hypothetical protein
MMRDRQRTLTSNDFVGLLQDRSIGPETQSFGDLSPENALRMAERYEIGTTRDLLPRRIRGCSMCGSANQIVAAKGRAKEITREFAFHREEIIVGQDRRIVDPRRCVKGRRMPEP